YVLELMRALPDVQFALATMGALISTEQRREAEELPNVALFTSSYALEWMDDPWADVDRAGDWLLEIAADFKPDLIHLNGYAHAALPWEQPVLAVAHSCVLSWWRAVKNDDLPSSLTEYQRRVSAGLAAADLVIAPTRAMLETLRPNYNFFGRAEVIHNARNPQLFTPAKKQSVIFAAGRFWDEAKNLAALDAVAPHVPWRIEVAGDAAHPNGSAAMCKEVRPLGKLPADELRDRLASAAIYALPARYEPFGLSALEAALSGCALVLGDIPSLREVWGDAAIFVVPDDHSQLANALTGLINDELRRNDFAERASERALAFTPEKMADGYRAAYAHCMAQRKNEVAT
nr:glycosyltransferase family 4 protein [Chthoniobacterales bacterium]